MSRRPVRTLLLLFALPLAGCVLVEGPMGPPGLDGESSRLMVTAIADIAGDASADLPGYVGINPTQPPALSCYETDAPGSGVWYVVGDGFSTTSSYCVATFVSGHWVVSMHAMEPGWTAAWVVSY